MSSTSGSEKTAATRQPGSRQRRAARKGAAMSASQSSGETLSACRPTKRPTSTGLSAKVLVRPSDWKRKLTQCRSAFQSSTGEKTSAASSRPSQGQGEASSLRPRGSSSSASPSCGTSRKAVYLPSAASPVARPAASSQRPSSSSRARTVK